MFKSVYEQLKTVATNCSESWLQQRCNKSKPERQEMGEGWMDVWGEATNLGSCPVDPAFGTGVNVDQHQPLHQGGVVQLQKRAKHQQQNKKLGSWHDTWAVQWHLHLQERDLFASIRNQESNEGICGVSQGSILRPLQENIFMLPQANIM